MSFRSRVLFTLFPFSCGLLAVTGYRLWLIPVVVIWLIGYFSFLADRRKYLKGRVP
jgi:hypothetical protein